MEGDLGVGERKTEYNRCAVGFDLDKAQISWVGGISKARIMKSSEVVVSLG